MWLLHFLPTELLSFIVNAILCVGLISTIFTFFILNRLPTMFLILEDQRLALQVVSVVILTFGVYFKGGYSTELLWREKVAEVQAQLDEAKKESEKVKVVIQEKVVTKTKVIKEKADTITQYVDQPVIQDFDKTCPLPKEAVDVHNEAARMNKSIEETRKESVK